MQGVPGCVRGKFGPRLLLLLRGVLGALAPSLGYSEVEDLHRGGLGLPQRRPRPGPPYCKECREAGEGKRARDSPFYCEACWERCGSPWGTGRLGEGPPQGGEPRRLDSWAWQGVLGVGRRTADWSAFHCDMCWEKMAENELEVRWRTNWK